MKVCNICGTKYQDGEINRIYCGFQKDGNTCFGKLLPSTEGYTTQANTEIPKGASMKDTKDKIVRDLANKKKIFHKDNFYSDTFATISVIKVLKLHDRARKLVGRKK